MWVSTNHCRYFHNLQQARFTGASATDMRETRNHHKERKTLNKMSFLNLHLQGILQHSHYQSLHFEQDSSSKHSYTTWNSYSCQHPLPLFLSLSPLSLKAPLLFSEERIQTLSQQEAQWYYLSSLIPLQSRTWLVATAVSQCRAGPRKALRFSWLSLLSTGGTQLNRTLYICSAHSTA